MKSLPVPVEARRGWPPGFVLEAEDRRALVRLTALRGITPRNLHRLAWDVGSARACVAAVRSGRAGSDADRSRIDAVDPGRILGATEAAGGNLVAAGDPGYPAELEDLADPPGWLFVRGRPVESRMLGVAVVGARKASALGKEVARELGRRLSGAGITVVSGAASGIDIAAHRGALAAGGPTLAVMGSGIDVLYPRSSADTLEAIAHAGTIVSEYPPGTPAEPHHFPARNRIVAALGRALVVVEGTARSGSRISVDHALDLGRDVFAVPGPVSSPLSETPLELIRDGATLIRGADDLLADLGIGDRPDPTVPDGLSDPQRRALGCIGSQTLPEAIARSAGLSIPETISALIDLELRGLIRCVGGRYERALAGPGVASP
jgi:DNA processing protein